MVIYRDRSDQSFENTDQNNKSQEKFLFAKKPSRFSKPRRFGNFAGSGAFHSIVSRIKFSQVLTLILPTANCLLPTGYCQLPTFTVHNSQNIDSD